MEEKECGCIGSDPEKGVMAQRYHPSISSKDIPCSSKGTPNENQNEPIEIKVISDQ
jgi:hypothetical protein